MEEDRERDRETEEGGRESKQKFRTQVLLEVQNLRSVLLTLLHVEASAFNMNVERKVYYDFSSINI